MSIRFAPATGSRHDLTARLLAPQRSAVLRLSAANDNRAEPGATRFDPLLVDALRHFAAHGLDAAARARSAALAAASPSDFAHWVAITGLFDRRLARQTERCARSAQD